MARIAVWMSRDGGEPGILIAEQLAHAIAGTAPGAFRSIKSPGVLSMGSQSALHLDPVTGCLLALDGRLYARGDLITTLQLRPGSADTAIVLAAYRRWGLDFPAEITGDFALVLWDPARRTLIAARDPLGIRPLCYSVTRSRIVLGSLPAIVLAAPDTVRAPNLNMIGDLLTQRLTSRQETLYRGISRLPPGHSIRIDATAYQLQSFWRIDQRPEIRYRHEREYAEHFRDLFETAVAERIADTQSPGLTLSGGLDSSAVAGMAQCLLVKAGGGRRLRAFSTRYPGLSCDEGPFIDAVCARWGITSTPNPFNGFNEFSWCAQARELRDLPEYPFATRTRPLYAIARQNGVSMLLTGEGGDFWHDGSTLPHRQMIRDGRLLALVRELRHEASYTGWLHALKLAAASLFWPLTPASVRNRWEAGRQGSASLGVMDPEFARSIAFQQRIRGSVEAGNFADAAEWQIQSRARGAVLVHFYEMMERTATLAGIELRHPLLDQRLLEFVSAVPDHIRRAGAEDRAMLRRGVSDLLPRMVLDRRDAPVFGVVLERALSAPEVRGVLTSPLVTERPWINADAYSRALADATGSLESGARTNTRTLYALWMVFAVEAWYRGVF